MGGGGAFALYVTSPSQCLTTNSTSDTVAGHTFQLVQIAPPTPLLFRGFQFYFAFFCPSCTILRHLSTVQPLPPTDLRTVYLQLSFILLINHYADNWTWLPTYAYIELYLTNNTGYLPGIFQEQNCSTGKCTVNTNLKCKVSAFLKIT